jgi:hypothetical protein
MIEMRIPQIDFVHRWLIEYWLLPSKDSPNGRYVPVGVWYQVEKRGIEYAYFGEYSEWCSPEAPGVNCYEHAKQLVSRIHPANLTHYLVLCALMQPGPPVKRHGIYVSVIRDSWPKLLLDMIHNPNPASAWRHTPPRLIHVERKLPRSTFSLDYWSEPREDDDD